MTFKSTAAVIAFALCGTAASAATSTLDFVEFSNNNEQGVVSGTEIISSAFDGEAITFSATSGGATPATLFPYFDNGQAGLGVCRTVNNPGVTANNGTSNQCSSGAGDDNVTINEAVTIAWDGIRTLSNILFTGEWHGGSIEYLHEEVSAAEVAANGGPSGRDPRATKTLLFGTSETAGLSRYTFAELATMSFENIRSATFAFDSDAFSVFDSRNLSQDNEQFYLASALLGPSRNTGVVPLPAGLPLLLAGLGAFGVMSRRRKAS